MAKKNTRAKTGGRGPATTAKTSGLAAGRAGKVVKTLPVPGDEDHHELVTGPARTPASSDANALVVLRRLAIIPAGATDHQAALGPAHLWAKESRLGWHANPLTGQVLGRRAAFLQAWQAAHRPLPSVDGPGTSGILQLQVHTEWRLAVGLGAAFGVEESGLSLHGTYGWPLLPASALKGLAAAGARGQGIDPDLIGQVLGGPRPLKGDPTRAGRGGVRFLDALPLVEPTVHRDVLTPHQQPYYSTTGPQHRENVPGVLPGEHHNPVPVPFLSVSGTFAVDLAGTDPDHLRAAANWLAWAGEELGAGGRTVSGYGYFTGTPPTQEADA
ncbi:type III-B CRISPR module RAMP protein Cmr6 [Nocardiopsis dassonvillei]|uniref:type III-B CRISPR module RAMP protein Cmr6 n=1 Tax=Nocardiopsis dassonvillei TaxID=2014 RepID=UPI00200CBCFB|nr:type III-B CRISPR module RAMP protein Cmr6 [Nocardiopsis dassonvillei]MCK9874109.1 type III-B CRISPR module RAMP protein Cmr6 [Nocardiopsis dassonvillei]